MVCSTAAALHVNATAAVSDTGRSAAAFCHRRHGMHKAGLQGRCTAVVKSDQADGTNSLHLAYVYGHTAAASAVRVASGAKPRRLCSRCKRLLRVFSFQVFLEDSLDLVKVIHPCAAANVAWVPFLTKAALAAAAVPTGAATSALAAAAAARTAARQTVQMMQPAYTTSMHGMHRCCCACLQPSSLVALADSRAS